MLLFWATAKVTASAISAVDFWPRTSREGLLVFEMEFLRRVPQGSFDSGSGDGPESQLRIIFRDFMRRRRTTSHENGFGRQDLEAGSVSVVQAFMVGDCLKVVLSL